MSNKEIKPSVERMEWYLRQDEFLNTHKAILYMMSPPNPKWIPLDWLFYTLKPIGKKNLRKALTELVEMKVIESKPMDGYYHLRIMERI